MNRSQKNSLKNYDPTMALHRAMRSHQWQIWKFVKGGIYKGERKRSWLFGEFYCICGVRKFFVRDSLGRRVTAHYAYPQEYRLSDLGLHFGEINDALWLIVFEREAAKSTMDELEQVQRERKAEQ